MKTLLEWLFENQQKLPDGVYTTNQLGIIFCDGTMILSEVKPTSNKYSKINKRIKKLQINKGKK